MEPASTKMPSRAASCAKAALLARPPPLRWRGCPPVHLCTPTSPAEPRGGRGGRGLLDKRRGDTTLAPTSPRVFICTQATRTLTRRRRHGEGDEAQDLPGHRCRKRRGEVCAVEVGEHLHDVGAHDAQAAQARSSASACMDDGRRTPGPGAGANAGSTKSMSNVRKALPAARSTAAATAPVPSCARSSQVITVKPRERRRPARRGRRAHRACPSSWSAGIDQPLFRGPAHDRAVRELLTEVLVPVSLCASNWMSAMGPWVAAAALSSARSTLWSPPNPMGTAPPRAPHAEPRPSCRRSDR